MSDSRAMRLRAAGAAGGPLAARREHSFQSLLELGQNLLVSLDLYATADLLMFNLMGQFAASRSALWLDAEEEPTSLTLVRSHGFGRQRVLAVGAACCSRLMTRMRERQEPLLAEGLGALLTAEELALVHAAGIGLFAPLFARGEVLGLLALGKRVDGRSYVEDDLQVLQAAVAMVGVSLQNARLYNRMRDVNRQLRQTNDHLRELDRLKSEFISNVNHELRTPLAVIIGALECVLEDGQLGDDARALLEAARTRSRDLGSLVENLLAFADLSNARLPVQIAEVDLGELLAHYHAERLPGITASLHEFKLERESGLPPAIADGQRVLQIVDELVTNALKFTPRGTRLELRLHGAPGNPGQLAVEVADDGPGIPPDRIESLFTPFEQVDGSSTRPVGGLGLGLSLARELAERMGCLLEVRSEIGRGTTFTLRVPAAAARQQPAA